MKRFQFRFDRILTYRRHQEKQRQRDLAAAENLRVMQEQKIAGHQSDRARHQEEQHAYLTGRIDPRRLSQYSRYYLLLKQRELIDRELLGRIVKEVTRRRTDLIAAAKQRKTYEKLEERDRERYGLELNRVLQKDTDDIGQKLYWRQR